MKFLAIITLASALCVAASPHSRHHKRRHHKRQACGAPPAPIFSEIPTPDVPVDETPAPAPAPETGASGTLVLFEVGGVPGNECLTFRNNGTWIMETAVWPLQC